MKLLATGLLLMATLGSADQGVQIIGGIGGDMSCVSRNCNSQDEQLVAKVDKNGVYEWLVDYEVKSVTGHGSKNGVTTVSCSGGCTITRGFFGSNRVCDSEGFCIDFIGPVKPIKHREISN